MANGTFGGGAGTLDNPYFIEDAADLNAIRTGEYITYHYRLKNDIDMKDWLNANMTSSGWVPIPSFRGVIDGAGFSISNLFCLNLSNSGTAFIANSYGAKIRNLAFKNIWVGSRSVAGYAYYAGIVAIMNTADCLIENCYVQGTINGYSSSGGIAAQCTLGTIKNCHVDIYIDIVVAGSANSVGGIVGSINGATIKNCYSIGAIGGKALLNSSSISMTIGTGVTTAGSNSISSVFGLDTGYPLATFVGTSSRKTLTELKTSSTFTGWDSEYYDSSNKLWQFITGTTPRLVFLDKEKYLFLVNNSYKTYDFILGSFSDYGKAVFNGEELIDSFTGTGGTSFTRDYTSSPFYTNFLKVVLTSSGDEVITEIQIFDDTNTNISSAASFVSLGLGGSADVTGAMIDANTASAAFDDSTGTNEAVYITFNSIKKITKIIINGSSSYWLKAVSIYAQKYVQGSLLGSTLPSDNSFIINGLSQDEVEQIPRLKLKDLMKSSSFDIVCNSDKKSTTPSYQTLTLTQDSQISDGVIMKTTLDFTTITSPIRQISIK